jgi:NADH:ubiquinone oxidoreductase subunit B-like Fe-S oxidoreductase
LLTADKRAQQLKLRSIKFGVTSCSAGSETWAKTEVDSKRRGKWERKMLRRIHGLMIEQGIWRMRTNEELREVYKNLDVVTDVNKKRL